MPDTRPKLLDLFCCAGGAATGYHRAGFDVYGVDIKPQPRYPFLIHVGSAITAMEWLLAGAPLLFSSSHGRPVQHLFLSDFAAIHASPPCQAHSDLQKQSKIHYADYVEAARELLTVSGKPYVMENVEGAPLIDPVTLCGTMFPGLRVLRHRLFESWLPLSTPEHGRHPLVFTHDKRKAHYGKLDQDTSFVQVTGGGNCSIANAKAAMGIDWMTKEELNEALPPVYTEYLGKQLLFHIRSRARIDATRARYSGVEVAS